MALAIKSIPVLTGKDAERFVTEAEHNCERKGFGLSKERKKKSRIFLKNLVNSLFINHDKYFFA